MFQQSFTKLWAMTDGSSQQSGSKLWAMTDGSSQISYEGKTILVEPYKEGQ